MGIDIPSDPGALQAGDDFRCRDGEVSGTGWRPQNIQSHLKSPNMTGIWSTVNKIGVYIRNYKNKSMIIIQVYILI